ncbi:SGNH/GDSL hydrolase family protein [Blastopirellula sp. JC732]|uniref:SGNH/GDSL hydrolase family protein n=1 Tax=Blastopirellula sediminis TaxID=2894196 RepID=A0A9X1MT70_9BACT|nr:SGNH/GDSL hydrolase family protein [Blastopirellula sediminis]MCC9605556.1 SGNH/GDSL hydrolase family protein [Blastopirellula sediminis]MCC9631144.1 SGNH/GDSL hydrolase family protein [Blastopirellula sediminis]
MSTPFRTSLRAALLIAVTLIAATNSFAQDKLEKSRQRLASGEPTKIVCFGDSITGVYYHSGSKRAWCDMLGLLLQQAYPGAKLEMINAGVSGHTTVNALARIERDVLKKEPNLVVIGFGMNDVARTPFEEFAPNLREIIRRCQEVGAEVVLCTPNAVSETEPRPEVKVAKYSEAIRAVAAELQLPVVDIFTSWKQLREDDPVGWSLLMSDEIHPNMTGHIRFAELIGSTIVGRPLKFDKTPPPIETLKTTLGRLAKGETVKLVAAPPFDTIIPAQFRKLYPEAKFDVVVWPAEEQTIAAAAEWAKQVRGLKPDLVVSPFPPKAIEASQEEFIRDYEWVLNYSLPQSKGAAWDVVPVLPIDSHPAYADLAARIIAGKELRFISRPSGDKRSADEIVAAWIAEHK